MQTALQKALKTGTSNLSEGQSKNALGQALTKLKGLGTKAEIWKDNAMDAGSEVIQTAETQGTLFLACMAEGYFGEDKLTVGVDVRPVVGTVATVFGLWDTLNGGKYGGKHFVAVGNGLIGSKIASVGLKAGRKLAEPAATTAVPAPTMQGAPAAATPGVGGPLREVQLTPEPQVSGMPTVQLTPETAGDGRFVRAMPS